jgi:hypothetical protein
MKCRLIQNTYLTVISSNGQHYNRHFEVGVEFELVGRTTEKDWILKCGDLRLFVTQEKMKKYFDVELEKCPAGRGNGE